MFCSSCGAQLKDGARFCPKCGTQTKAKAAQQAQPAVPLNNAMPNQGFQGAPAGNQQAGAPMGQAFEPNQPAAAQQHAATPNQGAPAQPQPEKRAPISKPATKIEYMTSYICFWLKGSISVDHNMLNLKLPNTIFKVIPLGENNENIPVNQLASVSSNFKVNVGGIISGLLLLLIALFCIALGVIGVIFAIIFFMMGACAIASAFETDVTICTTAGQRYVMPFLAIEKSKAMEAEKMVSSIIYKRLDDTNNRQVAESQMQLLIEALKSNQQ